MVAAGVLAAVILGGTAFAVTSDGSEPADEATAGSAEPTTPSQGEPADDGTDAPAEESPLNGTYDISALTVEAITYSDGGTIEENIGNVQEWSIFINCLGVDSDCFIESGFFQRGVPLDWTFEGSSVRGSGRNEMGFGDDCDPMFAVVEVDLTIDDAGQVTGSFITDADPGRVPCADGSGGRSGARYVYEITGQRVG